MGKRKYWVSRKVGVPLPSLYPLKSECPCLTGKRWVSIRSPIRSATSAFRRSLTSIPAAKSYNPGLTNNALLCLATLSFLQNVNRILGALCFLRIIKNSNTRLNLSGVGYATVSGTISRLSVSFERKHLISFFLTASLRFLMLSNVS